MKRLMSLFSVIVLTLCISLSPISLPLISSQTVEAATVKLNKSKLTVYVNKSYTLKLTDVKQKITWSSSDKTIASVTANGVVKGVKEGSATITAKVGNSKFTCKVTVRNPEISNKKLDMEVAGTSTLSIKGSSGNVKWKSSDNEVVSVNDNGFVYAHKEGTAKVTGTYKGKDYNCYISVRNKVIHASTTNLTCSRESVIIITVDDLPIGDYVYSQVSDESIITCEWGTMLEDSAPLRIILNGYGNAKITITADNTDEKLVIDVTVIDDKRPKQKKLDAEEVYEKCADATVQINTDKGLGSGFFISSGLIVTNYHVIKDAYSIQAQLYNGETYNVEYIVGYSESLDIALLSIPAETNYLPICPYSIKVGETIYAIGSPLGLTDTFTNGIITNASRYRNDVELIQINAAITYGNSGGPLINAYGEVIGINSSGITTADNLNFAINIYQIYQVDTSNPIKVSDLSRPAQTIDNNMSGDNGYIVENVDASYSPKTSQLIQLNTNIHGSIDPRQMDYFTLSMIQDSYINIIGISTNLNNTESSNLIVGIWNQDNNLLYVTIPMTADDGNIFQSAQVFLAAGTYYIGVCTKLDYKFTIPYTFVIYTK